MNCLQTLYLGEGSSAFEMFYECQMAAEFYSQLKSK